MPSVLWWLQAIGAVLTIVVSSITIATVAYSKLRGMPGFLRRFLEVDALSQKIDRLFAKAEEIMAEQTKSQHLQYQQAKAFNELERVVCEELEIAEDERPDGMNVDGIRREFFDHGDRPDFRRGEGLDGD